MAAKAGTLMAAAATINNFLRRYIFSSDHKVIGLQYFLLALAAALIGLTLSMMMRMRLAWPADAWPLLSKLLPAGFSADGRMLPEYYLSLMTMHGTIMIFFVLTIAPQAGLGSYFLPLQIGAANLAFPRWQAL